MALLTTTIGSYPKPDYVPVVDWFRMQDMALPDAQTANEAFSLTRRAEIEPLLVRATHEVVREQAEVGIDVPTDGEMRRGELHLLSLSPPEWDRFCALDDEVDAGRQMAG